MKINITLEVSVREQDYPLLSQASSYREMIIALKDEHIIDDVLVPELELEGSGITSIILIKDKSNK